jgi:regulator of RNase E activity RraA
MNEPHSAVTDTPDIPRPPDDLVRALQALGAATACATLHHLGVRDTFMQGPVAWSKGKSLAGPALTLQFMPMRQDLYGEGEYNDVEKQLHRHVLYHTRPGDIVVVDARGDMRSGIFGEMMLTYFKGRGGAGLVIDGCVRDFPHVQTLGLGLWLRGVTPNFHAQTNIMPFAVNVPIACGGVTVMPGDIIVADDDGACVIPTALAAKVIEHAGTHHDWEDFSREMLAKGGSLQKYYPLSEAARPEYEEWRKHHPLRGD